MNKLYNYLHNNYKFDLIFVILFFVQLTTSSLYIKYEAEPINPIVGANPIPPTNEPDAPID